MRRGGGNARLDTMGEGGYRAPSGKPGLNGRRRATVFFVIAIVVVACVVGAWQGSAGSESHMGSNDGGDVDPTAVDEAVDIDAAQYYLSHAEVVSETAVQDANVHTETEVLMDMNERGFGACEVTAHYTMDGSYMPDEAVGSDSESRHPSYNAVYESASGDLWAVCINGGHVMANPISYNAEMAEVETVLSESDTITSYDNRRNVYYELKPDPSMLAIKRVERIDAATLDALTMGEVASL